MKGGIMQEISVEELEQELSCSCSGSDASPYQ